MDIELYHKMSNCHPLLVDATGSIATKINDTFYFEFISYDRSVKTEPVSQIDILRFPQTYPPQETFSLSSFSF